MEAKPIASIVKNCLHIKVGDHKVDFHSGCSVADITFPNVFYVEIGEIHFKNYYTASISVLAKQKDLSTEGSEPKWKVVVKNMQLMPSPHCDQGSEDYFTITQKQMAFPLHNILGVRFVLRQPSPIWKEFKLEEFKFYKSSYLITPEIRLPTWLSETSTSQDHDDDHDKKLKAQGVPSINALSKEMQSLWALVEEAGSNQTKTSLRRYDVEGSYEINLLSYS